MWEKIIDWVLKTIFKNLKVKKADVENVINDMDLDKDGYIDALELIECIKALARKVKS